jgi:curved DNA-binding protein CbpA
VLAGERRVEGDVMTPLDGNSPYELLGVEPGADREAVVRAFRARIRAAHPDVPGGDAELAHLLHQARDILLDRLGEKVPASSWEDEIISDITQVGQPYCHPAFHPRPRSTPRPAVAPEPLYTYPTFDRVPPKQPIRRGLAALFLTWLCLPAGAILAVCILADRSSSRWNRRLAKAALVWGVVQLVAWIAFGIPPSFLF